MAGSVCKLCVSAGVDEATVTFETAEDFYTHVQDEHEVQSTETGPPALVEHPADFSNRQKKRK